jgi:uncharacterized protein YcfJ
VRRDWTALAAQYPERFVWLDGVPFPALSGGGGSAPKIPPPPGPTPQEIAIQEQQVKVLAQQVAALEKQNEINAAIPTSEVIATMREQLALTREEVERARARGPLEEKLALRSLEIAERNLVMAERGMNLQDALQPFVLQSLRLVEDTPGGALRRMTEDEFKATLTGQERLAYDNTTLALERETKALKGELPLSAAGQQRKRDEFTAFKEQMARGGNPIEGDVPGTASASTTAGAQALKAFNERWGLVEEAERRGELTSGSQSVLARIGVASDLGVRTREGLLSAVPRYAVPGFTGGRGGAGGGLPTFGAVSPDFAGALQPFQAQRAGITQNNLANAQIAMANRQQETARNAALGTAGGAILGGILGTLIFPGVGTAAGALGGLSAGAAIGGAAGGGIGYAASSRDVKKDIRRATRREEDRALEMVKDLKTHTFRYKHEPRAVRKRMGMMADEVPAMLASPDRRSIDVGRTLGLLTAATRALARKKGA